MGEHYLTREGLQGGAMVGTWTAPSGHAWDTLERPWVGNQRRISCVPCGRYQLVPWRWKGRYPTRALVGQGVGLYDGPGIVRTLILLHPANRVTELLGCVALGTRKGKTGELEGGTSRPAWLELLCELDGDDGADFVTIGGPYG